MTSPSRRPSRRATRTGRAHRAFTAVLATLGATSIALGALIGSLGSAPAASAAADPAASGDIVFTLAPAAGGIVTSGSALALTVSAYNPTLADLGGGSVRVTTSATPLADRTATRAWLAGEVTDDSRTETTLAETTLPAVAGRATTTATMSVDSSPLAAWPAGVYPIRADYSSTAGPTTSRSVLVVPAASAGGGVAVVVPVTAPARTTGLLTADELTKLTATGGELRDTLDAVAGTNAALAVDPAIVAAIRVLGSSAPASATQWLADLMSLPNTRFALQFGDADLATQIAAGLGAPLEPLPLTPYLQTRDFPSATGTPTRTPTTGTTDAPGGTDPADAPNTDTDTSTDAATPAPSPSLPTTPTFPTLAELTDVGSSLGAVFWPASGSAGDATVAALAAASGLTLLDSRAVSDARAPSSASANGGRLLVYDADTSAALGAAASSAGAPARDAALAAASAYGQFASADAGEAPVLVAVDRASSFPSLRPALQAASALAGRAAVGIGALTAAEPAAVTLNAVPDDAERTARLHALLSDEGDLESFSSILQDPLVLTSPERAAVLQLTGNGWRSATEDAAQKAVDDHRAQTRDTLGAVSITPPSDITLAATSAPLAFSVRNDLRWPVTVILYATRNDPRLIVQNTTTVEAGPAQNTRVQVPVQARVGSGDSTLDLQLRSITGVPIGDQVPVNVAVRAEWESVGLVVMLTIVALLLILGVVRTVRKLRRRGAPAQIPDDLEDADG